MYERMYTYGEDRLATNTKGRGGT